MKRMIACMTLAALLLTGCSGSKAPSTQTTQQSQAAAPAPLEILTAVWNAIPEESRFPGFGGDMTEEVTEGPGGYTLENTDALVYTLLVPEDQVSKVKEAASLIHMMNANTFTCGAFRLEGISSAQFADAMGERILNNQWMCGFPERLVIAAFGEDTVVSMYGHNDALNPFLDQMTKDFGSQMNILVDTPIE